jgi:hypothetical protein
MYILPLEKGVPLYLNKLRSPSPKNNVCQVWFNLAQWFSREVENVNENRPRNRRGANGNQTNVLELYAEMSLKFTQDLYILTVLMLK